VKIALHVSMSFEQKTNKLMYVNILWTNMDYQRPGHMGKHDGQRAVLRVRAIRVRGSQRADSHEAQYVRIWIDNALAICGRQP
jgi:hypothetical protein